MSVLLNSLRFQISARSAGQPGFDLTGRDALDVLRQVQKISTACVRPILDDFTPPDVKANYNSNHLLKNKIEKIYSGKIDLDDNNQFKHLDQLKEMIEQQFGKEHVASGVYGFLKTYALS